MVSRVLGYVRDFFIARVFGAGLGDRRLLRRLQAAEPAAAPVRRRGVLAGVRAAPGRAQAAGPAGSKAPDRRGRHGALPRAGRDGGARRGGRADHRLRHRAGLRLDPEKPFALTVSLLRITFPYIVFISLVSLSAGILNTWNRFSVPAITPALLNVAFIVGAAVLRRAFRSAGAGARLGGVRRRRAAARLPGPVPRSSSACCRAGASTGRIRGCAGCCCSCCRPLSACRSARSRSFSTRSSPPSSSPAACRGSTTPTG